MNMKKNKVLNAGIVGLGRWGQILVKAINHKQSRLLKFTHSYTRTISKAKLFCNKYSLTNCYSYEDLINNEDIDLIVLASPHSQHYEQIIKASKYPNNSDKINPNNPIFGYKRKIKNKGE